MPTLAAENDCYPANVLAEEFSAQPDRNWLVVYTRSRQEKALARHLSQHQVPFYLPLVKQERRVAGRNFRAFVPMFSGYVFLCANAEERVECLRSNRVSTIFEVPAGENLRQELWQIQLLLASNLPVTIEQRLAPGDRVCIRRGQMQGVEGRVISRRGKTARLLVAINFLQQGASIEIDDIDLELVTK